MTLPDAWLRGPVPEVPGLLQPVAHALLQAAEDIERAIAGLPSEMIWRPLGDAASIGFHVRHAAGSLNRLFTYARDEALSDLQRQTLGAEKARPDPLPGAAQLIAAFSAQVDLAIAQLRTTRDEELLAPRRVGRAGLPSNVIGLLVHAAEHTQRHVGQIITSARVMRSLP